MKHHLIALPGWRAVERKENDHDMVLIAEFDGSAIEVCLKCGEVSPKLHKHDSLQQEFVDTPMHGKRVRIQLRRQRWRHADCGGTFLQPITGIDDKRAMTTRLVDQIERLSLQRTFTQVADDVGVNEKTVRNIFAGYVERLEAARTISAPEWLGIDELFLIHKPRCMLTNVQCRSIVDLLANRDKKTVSRWLTNLPNRAHVKLVTMDMWRPYRDAVTAVLPNAQVVVDKFHVVKMANLCLDLVRKATREGMSTKDRRRLMHDRHILLRRESELTPFDHATMQLWTNLVPEIGVAYWAKEGFYFVYEASDRAEAERRYEAWKSGLNADAMRAYKTLITAVENWKPEIFAYFDHPVTNAYTESVNGLTKVTNRIGRGYSFDAIRAKILYGGKRKREESEWRTMRLEMASTIERYIESDVDIPQLIDELNADHDLSVPTGNSE